MYATETSTQKKLEGRSYKNGVVAVVMVLVLAVAVIVFISVQFTEGTNSSRMDEKNELLQFPTTSAGTGGWTGSGGSAFTSSDQPASDFQTSAGTGDVTSSWRLNFDDTNPNPPAMSFDAPTTTTTSTGFNNPNPPVVSFDAPATTTTSMGFPGSNANENAQARAPVLTLGPNAKKVKDEYLVKFKDDADVPFKNFKNNGHKNIQNPVALQNIGKFKGFSGKLTKKELEWLQEQEGVEYIEPNQETELYTTQADPTWGIDRSDQEYLPLDNSYSWEAASGAGVDVFVLDTGVQTTLAEFEGRASFLTDCTITNDACNDSVDPGDQHGHGTHVAGTVGSRTYGIAKDVQIHSVRVLNEEGSGSYIGVMNGINTVNNHSGTKKIISMSLGGGYSQAVTDAVDASFEAGVLNIVAAGNSDVDSCTISPAAANSTITVGATDSKDKRAYFSNYGICNDIFAPGVNITSTVPFESLGYKYTMSGTSMACPHVSGAAAIIWSRNNNYDAAKVKKQLFESATEDIISDPKGSPNFMLYTDPNE